MGSRRPTLQKKLLAWLLGPLLGLLAVDTVVTWSTSSGFSNHAYDRSLEEMAREVVLHVRPEQPGQQLLLQRRPTTPHRSAPSGS
ncbi:MAG: hypothetical protein EOO78_28255, partial [Oxalobacteraceae bacterium]